MKLTEITRKLKETFVNEYEVSQNLNDELKSFRKIYGDAETVTIGEMDYIVIDGEYKSDESVNTNELSLFGKSIKNNYAIIDIKTSSVLIDEVYSRIVYMRKECLPDQRSLNNKEKIGSVLMSFFPINDLTKTSVSVNSDNIASRSAKIFQCHLLKSTGVSASNDSFTFMIREGQINEITDDIITAIKDIGEVRLLADRDELESNQGQIQQVIFDKYTDSDIDIESVDVKSIFEISMSFAPVDLTYTDKNGDNGVFRSLFLASSADLDLINEKIHACNLCGHELIDVNDPSKRYDLHVNIDAIDIAASSAKSLVFATGCEDCLVKCEKCGKWHFDYDKLNSTIKNKLMSAKDKKEGATFAPGRAFIRNLNIDYKLNGMNFCSCREGIEWVYDELSYSDIPGERDIIALDEIVFVNYVGECVATNEEFMKFYNSNKKTNITDGLKEKKHAKEIIERFRHNIANSKYLNINDVRITSKNNFEECSVCGGQFIRSGVEDKMRKFRCDVCSELEGSDDRVITRIDGMMFLKKQLNKNDFILKKYVMTRLGRMKLVSTTVVKGDKRETTINAAASARVAGAIKKKAKENKTK